jgi:hypothetical protein
LTLPARSEAVYWVYSDSYLLVAIFSLLAILKFLTGKHLAAITLFAAALLIQEIAVVHPALLFVWA